MRDRSFGSASLWLLDAMATSERRMLAPALADKNRECHPGDKYAHGGTTKRVVSRGMSLVEEGHM
jgi:hypothetical protein